MGSAHPTKTMHGCRVGIAHQYASDLCRKVGSTHPTKTMHGRTVGIAHQYASDLCRKMGIAHHKRMNQRPTVSGIQPTTTFFLRQKKRHI
jgi:hypothetical protein